MPPTAPVALVVLGAAGIFAGALKLLDSLIELGTPRPVVRSWRGFLLRVAMAQVRERGRLHRLVPAAPEADVNLSRQPGEVPELSGAYATSSSLRIFRRTELAGNVPVRDLSPRAE